MKWQDIISSPEWSNLTPGQQAAIRMDWYDATVVPEYRKAGFSEEQITPIRNQDLTEFDNGQGGISSFFSSAGRGLAGTASGIVGGIGALTNSTGMMSAADEMDEAVATALPVNPSMSKTNFVGSVLGQVGGVIATGGAGGAVGKGLAGVRAVKAGSQIGALGSGALAGSRQGAKDAERYGMTGAEYAARVVLGGGIEVATEKLLFGMGSETGGIRRLLGGPATPGAPPPRGLTYAIGTESVEEGVSQVSQNASNTLLAAPGVKTPTLFSDVPTALAGGAIGGTGFGLFNMATGRDALPPPAGFAGPSAAPPSPLPVAAAPVAAAPVAAAPVAAVPPALAAARAIPPGYIVKFGGLPFAFSEADGGWLRPSTPDELLANPTALMRPLDPNDPADGAVIPQLFAKAEAWHRQQKDKNPAIPAPIESQPVEVPPIETISTPDSVELIAPAVVKNPLHEDGVTDNLSALSVSETTTDAGGATKTGISHFVTEEAAKAFVDKSRKAGAQVRVSPVLQKGIRAKEASEAAARLNALTPPSPAPAPVAESQPPAPQIAPSPAPNPETAALEAAFRSAQANSTPVSIDTPDGNTVEVTPESLVAAFRRATGQPETPAANDPAQELAQPPVEGRAQPLTAPVFTPTGPVAIGTLQPGDNILASDGTTQQVTGVFPQAVKPVFQIHLADGPTAPATEDHLWLARRGNEDPEVVTTARLMDGLDAGELWEIPMLAES